LLIGKVYEETRRRTGGAPEYDAVVLYNYDADLSMLAPAQIEATASEMGPLSRAVSSWCIAGPIPPNPGEFVGGPALDEILGYLRERFDVVLIDAPPALQVNDALALSSKVDALIVITRMNVVRRHMLSELRRMLDRAPAEKLGFIVTGAKAEEGYGYADDYYYGSYTRAPEKEPAT